MEPSRPLTAEEEAQKKSTDCIYFLASPFTCKKGNECDFRHSEAARVNPKDCWFWLNGNCLNTKCAFRHPPLDGLLGVPETPSGMQGIANAPDAYNPNKQGVTCIFFQKGQCLKGGWCPFVHVPRPASSQDQLTNGPHLEGNSDPQQLINGPHAAGNHVQQQVVKVSTSFSGTSQPVPWGIRECDAAPQQAISNVAVNKPVEFPYPSAKSAHRAEGPVMALLLKKSPSPYPSEYEPPRSLPTVAPVSHESIPGMPHHQPQATEEHYLNGREADEFLGESSPGFDVLVDDEEDYGRESEYYYNEDEYGRASVHGGRNLNQSVNDNDYHHPDYEAIPSSDRDQYNGKGEYDCYGRARSHLDQDHRRASSERAIDRIPKRRPMHRELSPDKMDGVDLRHRLLKQRRLGLRSPPRHDHRGKPRRGDDRYVVNRYPGRSSGRDQDRDRNRDQDRRHVPQESSFSSRLQGRITLPARSPPPHRPFELQSERDRDRESGRPFELQSERARERRRSRGRLSPPRATNYKGRLQDRIKQAPNEEFTLDGRSSGARPNRRDDGGDSLNFAGPKSLAELKGAKVSGSSQEQPTKSINIPLAAGYEASEDPLTFEGPKPLSDILKRKRQTASVNASVPSSGDESNGRYAKGSVDSAPAAAAVSGEKEGDYTDTVAEKLKAQTAGDEEEEGLVPAEGKELPYDANEDQELENFENKDGGFVDEAMEGAEDFKAEDGENAYPEDENLYQDDDEDDEDDFAKKVGNFFK